MTGSDLGWLILPSRYLIAELPCGTFRLSEWQIKTDDLREIGRYKTRVAAEIARHEVIRKKNAINYP